MSLFVGTITFLEMKVRPQNPTSRYTRVYQPQVPFLPVRDDFHPKRNQARQKLATLPKTRFKDLASDVFFELGRRYPEFKEPEVRSCFTCFATVLIY